MTETATQVKERPIPFTAESVRAILKGRKVQTRRVVKPQPELRPGVWRFGGEGPWRDTQLWYYGKDMIPHPRSEQFADEHCPYGQPGDRLYVKEAHHLYSAGIQADEACIYRADGEYPGIRWRSPRFMPRWASRLLLEIEDVRVERLQEITPEDCVSEGVPLPWGVEVGGLAAYPGWESFVRLSFIEMWNRVNRKRGYPWEQNDWVWVLTFKRVE